MPSNDQTLVKLKIGSLDSVGVDEHNMATPAIEGGSVLFAVDEEHGKGKILLDLPDGSQRIIMSTDAEYADTAGTAITANSANIASVLSVGRTIDGVEFNGSENIIHYTTCTVAGNIATKTATCANFNLAIGSRIMVKYANTNSANNPTLNINSTGAKPIYYKGAAMPTPYIQANAVHEYVYDGTN